MSDPADAARPVQEGMNAPLSEPAYASGCTDPDFEPWWDRFGTRLGDLPLFYLALAAFSAGRHAADERPLTITHRMRAAALPPVERRFVCFFNFLGWWHWSLGIHLDVRHPHIGLHVPFGFLRLGWSRCPTIDHPRQFGYDGWTAAAMRDAYHAE